MQYRILGKTGLKVSSIGCGTWGFANDTDAWVGATKKESEAALFLALDQGVNFIDTARVYGEGLAEEWLGEMLQKTSQKQVLVATKMTPLNQQWSGMVGTPISEAFPKQHIIDQVDASLRALRRDYLDVVYFHVWEDEWSDVPSWKEAVTELTQAGKVRFWGISTNDFQPTNCLKACQTGLISVIMTIFNIFAQEPISELLPAVKKMNLGLVSRVPLDEGGLSGSYTHDTEFPEGDFRQTYFSKDRLVQLNKHLDALRPLIKKSNAKNVAEFALRYVLSFPEVTVAVPGMRRQKYVIANTKVSDLPPLPQGVLEEMPKHAWFRNFYDA